MSSTQLGQGRIPVADLPGLGGKSERIFQESFRDEAY
jgi:hypothetical protein